MSDKQSMTPFLCPANISVLSPQQGGKTTFVKALLENLDYYFKPPPKKVLYCYSTWQDLFTEMEMTVANIEFHRNLPDASFIDQWCGDKEEGSVIVVDDLMISITSSHDMVQLFTVKCHHQNITTIMLNQSIFPTGKFSKTLSLNCNYFSLFQNFRDAKQVKCLGSQMFPNKLSYFMDAYRKATATPYGFLCIDIHPKGDRKLQLRSNILKGQQTIIYTPKEGIK